MAKFDCSQCSAWTTIVCNSMAATPTTQWSYGKFGIPDKKTCDGCLKCVQQDTANAVNQTALFQGLQGLVNAFQTLTSPSTWIRVGLFAFAFMLVIIGFMIVASQPSPVQAPAQLATKGVGAGVKSAYNRRQSSQNAKQSQTVTRSTTTEGKQS
jgi:hypothetical protein